MRSITGNGITYLLRMLAGTNNRNFLWVENFRGILQLFGWQFGLVKFGPGINYS